MRKISFVLTISLLSSISFGQIPSIVWQNTIGGVSNDDLRCVRQTSDGGYILGGWSESNISGDKMENSNGDDDYWVVKLDAIGNIIWQNTIGGSNDDRLYSLQQTADGGYILGGTSISDISGDKTENKNGSFDYWVVKLDATGGIVWQNTIGGSFKDQLESIQQTTDGGYILGGTSISGISGDKTENSYGNDCWVVKLNAAGNIIWQNNIGGNGDDRLHSLQQTTDGGYILGATSNSDISGDKTENSEGFEDFWVVKLDATGNIIWQNTIGGSNDDQLYSLQQTTDGGYILGGRTHSDISGDKTENGNGNFDYWVVKLDATGNIIWQNTIGGSSYDRLESVQQTNDGGYILGGYSQSNISGDKTENSIGMDDYWVVKLGATGNIIWQNTLGGSHDDDLYSLQQTIDGGYILGGWSESSISGDKTENSNGNDDYWVVKLSPANLVACFSVVSTSVECGLAIVLDGNCSFHGDIGKTIDVYEWDFDDDGIFDATGVTALNTFTSVGTQTVKLRVTDNVGDLDSSTLLLTINDTSAPIADVATLSDVNSNCAISPTAPTATDNCTGSITGTTTTTFPITTQGTTQVTWTYDDGNGQVITQTQDVIIDDVTNPLPDIVSLSSITGECSVSSPTAPTATDNCTGSITGTTTTTFPVTTLGTTQIIWTYDDGNGQVITQSQNIVVTEIDNSVFTTGITISANASGGYTYQWIDCDNNNSPIGVNSQAFTPTASGNYAVEISDGSCTVTSVCTNIQINGVGVLENGFGTNFTVYPNPTSGQTLVSLGKVYENITVQLKSINGQLIETYNYQSAEVIDIEINGADGLYLIDINAEAGETAIVKVLKE